LIKTVNLDLYILCDKTRKEGTLPERFNFPVLVEISDDKNVRVQIVEKVTKIFSQWFCEIDDVVLIDWNNPELTTRYSGSAGIQNYALSNSQILFLYFTCEKGDGRSILSISKNFGVIVYTISLPAAGIRSGGEKPVQFLGGLFSEISALGLHCIVTAGGELELEKNLQSVSDVIQSASDRLSLVEYLCCDKRDAARLTNFILIEENGEASVFHRAPS
jgi:hypothetical protein